MSNEILNALNKRCERQAELFFREQQHAIRMAIRKLWPFQSGNDSEMLNLETKMMHPLTEMEELVRARYAEGKAEKFFDDYRNLKDLLNNEASGDE